MKPPSLAIRRRLMVALSWCGVAAFFTAAILAYRWAEPSPAVLAARNAAGGGGATVRLLDTPFAGYINGARSWSIRAGQVDILRLPNATITNIQSADIEDIREGSLYEPPSIRVPAAGVAVTRVMQAGGASPESGPVSATFKAKHGHYSAGALQAVPADLEMLFTVQWQFKLSGDVVFRTRANDVLSAPAMIVYSLLNRKSGLPEQRVLCDQGATLTHVGIAVTANSLRFNPKDRTVECLSGVRGTFKEGSVQAERVYWSLADEVLRCPESATGIIQGMPFSAEALTLDVKHRRHHGNRLRIQIAPGTLTRFN